MTKLLRTTSALVLALGLAVASTGPSLAKGNKTGRIVGGVAAGVAGAIILNEIAKGQRERGYEERSYYTTRPRISCRELDERCYDGQRWACRKLDREC
jgi:hypothetical protein